MKEEKVLNDSIYKSILQNALTDVEYQIIDNIFQYAADIKNELILHIKKQCDITSSTSRLKELKDEVENLIKYYSLSYLEDVYNYIEIKIEQQVIEEQQLELTRINTQQQLELARINKQVRTKCYRCNEGTEYNMMFPGRKQLSVCGHCHKIINWCIDVGYDYDMILKHL